MTKIIFTFSILLLASGCEDMKMDRKIEKHSSLESHVSQRHADQEPATYLALVE
jgi:hypothetical protein